MGNERKAVFKSRRDREKFLEYLESASERYGAVIHIYCLMDNHYHLLIETPAGNLAQIMQHINSAYTTYFNVKRKRSGHLFQGRYRSIVIEADTYAKELSRYIHLNPVRAGMADTPEEYEWSSYLFYAVEEEKPAWLSTDFILGYFAGTYSVAQQKYRSFVESLIGKQYRSPLTGISLSAILGLPDFVDEIKGRFLSKERHDGYLPSLNEPADRPSMEEIDRVVGSTAKENNRSARQMQIYLCHRYTGARLLEIGNRFGIGESAVSQNSRRFSERLRRDRELRRATKLVEKELGVSSV
jgi:REP element-mobilizing transposase RayT